MISSGLTRPRSIHSSAKVRKVKANAPVRTRWLYCAIRCGACSCKDIAVRPSVGPAGRGSEVEEAAHQCKALAFRFLSGFLDSLGYKHTGTAVLARLASL